MHKFYIPSLPLHIITTPVEKFSCFKYPLYQSFFSAALSQAIYFFISKHGGFGIYLVVDNTAFRDSSILICSCRQRLTMDCTPSEFFWAISKSINWKEKDITLSHSSSQKPILYNVRHRLSLSLWSLPLPPLPSPFSLSPAKNSVQFV